MVPKHMPSYVNHPILSPLLIEEIADIIFGELVDPEPCNLIFIFGGSHPGLWEKGAEAYFKGYGKDILATGGYKPGAIRHHTWVHGKNPESEVIRDELIYLGVPEKHIFTESRSTNTYENVHFARQIYDFDQIASILAVCKSYAVGRQIRTLQAQLPGIRIIPYPFDTNLGGNGPFVTRDNWMDLPEVADHMFANLLKIVQYGRVGHLVPVAGFSDELSALVQNFMDDDG
jgi:uncharacterized SAM-binding protein YcdF (DUF218 family)